MGGVTDAVFGGGDAPTINTPDPAELIKAQAQANRVDSYNPFGSLTYAGKDRNQQTLQLTPELQVMLDSLLAQSGSSGDFVGELQNRSIDRLNQEFDPMQRQLQNQLMQQGIPSTGADLAPGAVSELGLFNRGRNDAYIDAILNAESIGSQLQGQNLSNIANLGMLPMIGQGAAAPIDVTGAYQLNQNAQLANAQLANQQQSSKNNLIGDLGGAGAEFFASGGTLPGLSGLKGLLGGGGSTPFINMTGASRMSNPLNIPAVPKLPF